MATRTISIAGGNWNTTGAWDEGAVPTSADDVVARGDGASGNLTLTDARSVKSINFTNYAAVFTHNAGIILTIAGSGGVTAKWVAGMTYTLGNANSCQIVFTGTSGTTLFTTGTKTFGTISLQGAGGTVQLQDNLATAALIDLEAGTWDFNNKNATLHAASGQTGFSTFSGTAKTVILGTGTITTDSWSNTAANTTVTIGASGLIFVTGNSSGSIPWTTGANVDTYYDVKIDGPTDATFPHIIGSSTFHDLTLLQLAGAKGGLSGTFLTEAGKTLTVNGTFIVAGLANKRLFILSGTPGVTSAINAAAVSLSNVCFIDIAAGGAASPWTGTLLGDGQNNSGITFTAAAPQYWFGDNGNWSDPTKWFTATNGVGAGRVPLPQDHAIADQNSFTANGKTITQDLLGQVCHNLDFSAITKTVTLACSAAAATNSLGIFGATILSANLTITATSAASNMEILDRTGALFTSAGVSIPNIWRIVLPGTSVTLQDPLVVTSSSGILLDSGTINMNGFAVTTPKVSSSNASTRSINTGAGTLTVTGAGTCWDFTTSTGASFAGTGTLKFTDATASAKTLAFGGVSYGTINLWISGAGSGVWTISGSNTFADIKITTGTKTVNVTAGTTQTVSTFNANGDDSTHKITLQSTISGTAWNLSCASGVISDAYLSIKDSHASGGARFLAYESTSVSGNTGWEFVQIVLAAGIGEGVGTGPNLDAMSAAGVGRGFGAGSLSAHITFVADGVGRGVGSADIDTAILMAAAGVGEGVGSAVIFVADFPTVTVTIEVLDDSTSPAVWVDISDDVDLFSSPIIVEYGITGSDPIDRVANAGRGMFNLDDSEFNSTETLGLYSLFHADRLAAFDLDKEIRISFGSDELGGYSKYKFRGRLVDAPPDAGIYGDRLTRCSALDWFDDAADAEEPDIPLQVEQRVDQIAQALFDALNRPPTTTIIEQGSDILELAVDGGTGQKLTMRNRLQQLMCTEFGYAYPIGDETEGGTVRLENRYHRLSNPDVMFEVTKIDTIEMRATRDDFYRRVRVTVHPVNDYANAEEQIVFSIQQASIVIQAGETNTSIFGPYVDPDSHQRIGASDTQDPDPGSPADYAMVSVDGMDEDLTAFFTVTASRTGLGVAWTITNNGLKAAEITKLTLRGKPIFRYDLFIEREVTGVGDKTLPFDMAFQNSAKVGELIAGFLADTRSTPAAHVHSVRFLATTDTNHLRAAIQLEPGDRIALTEEVTGLDAAEFTINGVQLEYREGGDLWCTWILEVASTHQYFPLSTLGAIEVGQLTSGTFSTSEELIMPHEFGGTNQASRNETTYPVGATLDKLVLASDVVTFNSTDLPAGTYNLVVTLATDGGGTVTVALVNLTDDPATALVEVASTSATGEQVISGAISFAAGGSPKTYGLKMKVTTGNGYAWCARLVRTA